LDERDRQGETEVMSGIAVLDDYQGRAAEFADWASLNSPIRYFRDHLEGEAFLDAVRDCDVIVAMRERTQLDAEVLAALPNLQLLVTTGMANAAIDLEAAHRQGVVVSGTPSSGASTVELTWALLLAAVKHLPLEDQAVRQGRWQTTLAGDLAGKRLGLIGLGRLGAGMVPVAKAFEMEVVAWSQNLTSERAAEVGVKMVTKDELISTADVISIHVRLSERTRALIGEREIAMMRPGVLLLNTSRGPIIDEAALVAGLRENRISAALDVYDLEPLPVSHPLTSLSNVVLAPHLGYASEDNVRSMYACVVEDIAAFRSDAPIRVL
jgi:phosphoglycerate dehydrogenase-like enzyme